MNRHGKNIQLYLMDGDANGRIKCTMANWTGVAYKIPRTMLEICHDRADLKQSGVYFLLSRSDDNERNAIYVGQAGARKNGEGILNRLMEHKRNPEKNYWSEAVVFTTSNNSFGPTEISYLENRFTNLAIKADRYDVKNANDPTQGNITEEKESELEEFVEYAQVIMGALGHRVFIPLVPEQKAEVLADEKTENPSDLILYLKQKIRQSGQTIEARCRRTTEGFVVLPGSQIEENESPTGVSNYVHVRRKETKIDENGILQKNELFSSPSAASSFVLGQASDGWVAWKDENGVALEKLDEPSDEATEESES